MWKDPYASYLQQKRQLKLFRIKLRSLFNSKAHAVSFALRVCNETVTAVYRRISIVNKPAQLVHHVIRAYAASFKKSDLWLKIVSRIRKCTSDVFIELLQQLEVNPEHSLERNRLPQQWK